MSLDRLAELRRAAGPQDVPLDEPVESALAEYVQRFVPLKENFDVIRRVTARVGQLAADDLVAVRTEDHARYMSDVDQFAVTVNQTASASKRLLDTLKPSADDAMRTGLYRTHIRRLHMVINEFNQVLNKYKSQVRDRDVRHLEAVAPELSDDQRLSILESGQADVAITEALDMAVSRLEKENEGIRRIEKQVNEIYNLFTDMAFLVEQQQETLDSIESHVASAKERTADGERKVTSGQKYQKRAGKLACMIAIIIAVLAFLIMWFIL